MIYIEYPPQRTISGQVVNESDGTPVPHATILFYSERSHIGLSTNHGIDATAHADKNGRFALKARLNDKVTALVYKDGHYQSYQLQPFPDTNTLDNIVWRFDPAASQ